MGGDHGLTGGEGGGDPGGGGGGDPGEEGGSDPGGGGGVDPGGGGTGGREGVCEGGVTTGLAAHPLVPRQRTVVLQNLHPAEH